MAMLLRVLRRILPYRIYYGLFEAFDDMQTAKFNMATIAANCRRASRIALLQKFSARADGFASDLLNSHELSVYSQNGEDGILLYIFGNIGVSSKIFVEFGVEDGKECNSANLAICFGWRGLLMDGCKDNVAEGRRYYDKVLGDRKGDVSFVQAFVTAENINDLLSSNGVSGEIDLLSIDIDGNDYWVWKAISAVNPRVVAIEYNASFGPDKKVTIPYQPDFVWNSRVFPDLLNTGASLACLNSLAIEKGYKLVGCDSAGVNAFFVRADVMQGKIPSLSVQDAYFPHAVRTFRFGLDAQRLAVETFNLIQMDRVAQ